MACIRHGLLLVDIGCLALSETWKLQTLGQGFFFFFFANGCQLVLDARFSPMTKKALVGLVCVPAALCMLGNQIIFALLIDIQLDFNTSFTAVSGSVTAFTFLVGVSPLVLAPYSDILGRRIIYLICLFFTFASSIGCGLAPSIAAFIGLRVVQAISSSIGLVAGAAVMYEC